ncbi:MAG: hypothetical protein Q8O55_04115 [Dehalococcoidales bacterium]|nr:hypothetical protein [Dehalococcoidales bacterium]
MVYSIKDLLKKASSVFSLINLSADKAWPAGVLNQLEVEYHLKPEDMLRLGYLKYRMKGMRKGFYSLYIYDRLAARDRQRLVRDVKDINNSSDLLLFRGSVSGDGVIQLSWVNGSGNN